MSRSLRIVETKFEYYLDLVDGPASLRLAKFTSPRAMAIFCEAADMGIKTMSISKEG